MIAESYSLFKKDFHSELRTRYAINSLAMFIIVAISVILFSIGNETITESLTAGLFWVVIFFTAMSGLSRAFVSEEERGTTLTLQLIASPTTVFSGKLIFNLILVFCMNLVIALLYSALFEKFVVQNFALIRFNLYFGKYWLSSCIHNYCSNYCKSWCKRHTLSSTFLSDFITFDSYLCSTNFVLIRWYKL